MEAFWPWLVYGGGGALILYLLLKAGIAEYFVQKRRFVDELVKKQKGIDHG